MGKVRGETLSATTVYPVLSPVHLFHLLLLYSYHALVFMQFVTQPAATQTHTLYTSQTEKPTSAEAGDVNLLFTSWCFAQLLVDLTPTHIRHFNSFPNLRLQSDQDLSQSVLRQM